MTVSAFSTFLDPLVGVACFDAPLLLLVGDALLVVDFLALLLRVGVLGLDFTSSSVLAMPSNSFDRRRVVIPHMAGSSSCVASFLIGDDTRDASESLASEDTPLVARVGVDFSEVFAGTLLRKDLVGVTGTAPETLVPSPPILDESASSSLFCFALTLLPDRVGVMGAVSAVASISTPFDPFLLDLVGVRC